MMPKQYKDKRPRYYYLRLDNGLYNEISFIAQYLAAKGVKAKNGRPVSISSLINEAAMNIPVQYEDTLRHIYDLMQQNYRFDQIFSGKL